MFHWLKPWPSTCKKNMFSPLSSYFLFFKCDDHIESKVGMILIQEDGALNAQINSNQEDPSSRSLVHHHSKCKLSLLLWGLVFTTICTRSQATGTNPSTQQPAPQAPETETETADHRQQQAFAVCAVVKDRPAYVAEWLDYHAALGVQKFYLFDTDNPDHSSLRSALQVGTLLDKRIRKKSKDRSKPCGKM